MTVENFLDIIDETRYQTDKVSHLERQRKKFQCLVSEFVNGLRAAFKNIEYYHNGFPDEDDWLYEEIRIDNIMRFQSESISLIKDLINDYSIKMGIEVEEGLDGARTFHSEYSMDHIDTIRLRLIESNYISEISRKDFEYLFSEKPIIKLMIRMNWKKSNPQGHYFLEKIVYINRDFDNIQVNKCINLKRPMDSGDKPKNTQNSSTYEKLDILVKF
jgi:hypothetical protein